MGTAVTFPEKMRLECEAYHSIGGRSLECVELYLHSPVHLHGLLLRQIFFSVGGFRRSSSSIIIVLHIQITNISINKFFI